MSPKPKKSRAKKMDPNATPQPAAAAPADQPTTQAAPIAGNLVAPPAGTVVMAKSPAINGQWQMAKIVENPGDPTNYLVEFPDGSQYLATSVEMSAAPVAPTTADPRYPDGVVPGTGYAANIGTLDTLQPRYAEFRRIALELYSLSNILFQMPLQSVITMAYRQAYRGQLEANGKMDVIGNETIFVPDNPTFERWMTAYLEEVQRRESEHNGPEA
jgi:hypothetical protein